LVAHSALAIVLIGISAPLVPRVASQLGSDYVPDYMPLVAGLVALPMGLATATLVGLVAWMLWNTRSPLLAVDVATVCATWSVFPIFVMAGDLPIALLGLAPICLVIALAAAVLESRHFPAGMTARHRASCDSQGGC
jgi:hypothetical protein